jgi:hypothetical protein
MFYTAKINIPFKVLVLFHYYMIFSFYYWSILIQICYRQNNCGSNLPCLLLFYTVVAIGGAETGLSASISILGNPFFLSVEVRPTLQGARTGLPIFNAANDAYAGITY